MRLWDCAREARVCDLATQLDTCVTCIQSGHADSRHVAAVSFGDGHVKVSPELRLANCVDTVL